MTLAQVYQRAARKGITIDEIRTRELPAAAFPEGWIIIDPSKFETEIAFKCALAHELAHCETGSFYNVYSHYDLKYKCEYKAKKRMCEMLMPVGDVIAALRTGSNRWSLAAHFDVTEEVVDIALALYADVLLMAN